MVMASASRSAWLAERLSRAPVLALARPANGTSAGRRLIGVVVRILLVDAKTAGINSRAGCRFSRAEPGQRHEKRRW